VLSKTDLLLQRRYFLSTYGRFSEEQRDFLRAVRILQKEIKYSTSARRIPARRFSLESDVGQLQQKHGASAEVLTFKKRGFQRHFERF